MAPSVAWRLESVSTAAFTPVPPWKSSMSETPPASVVGPRVSVEIACWRLKKRMKPPRRVTGAASLMRSARSNCAWLLIWSVA